MTRDLFDVMADASSKSELTALLRSTELQRQSAMRALRELVENLRDHGYVESEAAESLKRAVVTE